MLDSRLPLGDMIHVSRCFGEVGTENMPSFFAKYEVKGLLRKPSAIFITAFPGASPLSAGGTTGRTGVYLGVR